MLLQGNCLPDEALSDMQSFCISMPGIIIAMPEVEAPLAGMLTPAHAGAAPPRINPSAIKSAAIWRVTCRLNMEQTILPGTLTIKDRSKR